MDEQDVAVEQLLFEETPAEAEWQLPTSADLPANWKLIQLGEVCESAWQTMNPADFPDEEFEYYSIPAFQESGEPIYEQGGRILSNKLLVRNGTVLFGKLNPRVLKVWLVRSTDIRRKIASTEFLPVLAKSAAEPEFLYYICQSAFVVQEARRLVSGSTPSRQRVDPKSFYEITIPLPPLPEQRAIAHTLRTVQEAIQARRRESDLERERKAALMQHLFTYGTRGEPIKQTEIGVMPESWRVVQLGNKAEVITKGSSPNWQGFEYCNDGIIFVRSQNIGWGRLELEDVAYLPEAFNKKERRSIIRENDLLVNLVGASIGRAALANGVVAGGNLNQAVAIARLLDDYEPGFVMYFLLTEEGQAQLHRQKKDIARANLSLQDISNLSIPYPSLLEQQVIAHVLKACDSQATTLEQEITLLEELFRALLEELMTGRLSVVPLMAVEVAHE